MYRDLKIQKSLILNESKLMELNSDKNFVNLFKLN